MLLPVVSCTGPLRGAAAATAAIAMVLLASPEAAAKAPPRKAVEPDRYEQAREAMRGGLAAMAREDHEDAVRQFRRAQELVPDANLPHRFEAEALSKLGRYDEAISAYEHYLALKPDVSDRERVTARIAELSALRPAVAAVSSDPPGAEIFLDGAAAPACATPCSVSLAPGEHQLRLRARGHADASLSVRAEPAARPQLFAKLVPATTAAGPPSPPSPSPSEKGSSTRRAWGLGVGLTGAGLLGVGAVADATWVSSRIDGFEAARAAGSDAASDELDRARFAQQATIGVLVAGAVLLVAGVVLMLWPSSSSDVSSRTAASAGALRW